MRPTAKQPLLRRLLDNVRLMGILALVVAGVAVLLAYRSQNGVPLAGTYHVSVDVPDAAKLTKHADVRIGGARVGQVLKIEAEPRRGATPPFARVELGLDRRVGPLPKDTTAEVRLASVLGGKYLALVPGKSGKTVPAGGGLPLSQGVHSVDIDDALRVFKPSARRSIQTLIGNLGDGVAGRGIGLGDSIANLRAAVTPATRVLQTMAAPGTNLGGFVHGLALATSAVEPVAGTAADLLGQLDTTVAGIDRAGDALPQSLAAAPPTEDALTQSLASARPALGDAAAIARSLSPAANELRGTTRALDSAALAAIPAARDAGSMAPSLQSAFEAVDRFGQSAASRKALKALGTNDLATFGGSAFVGLGAILHTAADAQLSCNVFGLWARNLASTASEGDTGGNWLRMIPVLDTGQMLHERAPSPDLHVNPYPHEDSQECESGNEPYTGTSLLGNPVGLQSRHVDSTGGGG